MTQINYDATLDPPVQDKALFVADSTGKLSLVQSNPQGNNFSYVGALMLVETAPGELYPLAAGLAAAAALTGALKATRPLQAGLTGAAALTGALAGPWPIQAALTGAATVAVDLGIIEG